MTYLAITASCFGAFAATTANAGCFRALAATTANAGCFRALAATAATRATLQISIFSVFRPNLILSMTLGSRCCQNLKFHVVAC